jgi:Josephin
MQETQYRQQCLLHTINNLLQETAFTASDLDRLADSLAPGKLPLPLLHPHRTLFVGNYDVSVLELAIESVGKSLKWHDQRDKEFNKTPALLDCFGLVVNIKPPGRVAALLGTRHWFAIRKLENVWYNLDSKLAAPQRISECVKFVDSGGGAGGESAAAVSSSLDEDTALRIFLTTVQKDSDAKILLIT